MSILAVCNKCRKSFKVSDKFAGQTGPCPNCKAPLKVPTKQEEVKVHAPTQFADGGRSVTGELLTKPIARKQTKLQPVVAVAIGGAAAGVLLVSWVAGGVIQSSVVIRTAGLMLISPPLVVAAYSFLRNDELQPYQGVELYVRATICGLVYVLLWGGYGYVAGAGFLTGDLWEWLFVAPPFLVVGALAALASLDLDFGNGFFHYSFYVLVTVLLRAATGMGWIWDIAEAAPV